MALPGKSEVGRLADQLERSFRGGAWHGPATREALTGVNAATAQRRLNGSSNAIVEHVRHLTFWLKTTYVRIGGGEAIGSEADWPREEVLSDDAWLEAIAELERAHAELHTAILDLDDDRLDDAVAGSDPTIRGLLLGILQHNAYHTGQIVQIAKVLGR